jgi:hypothetical protein
VAAEFIVRAREDFSGPVTHPLIRKKFLSLLGITSDWSPPGELDVRGKRYRFKSWTELYDASRGRLSDYEQP